MTKKRIPDPSTPLANHRHEAFAQAFARGVRGNDAAKDAGYITPRQGPRLGRVPAVIARVDWVKADLAGGGSRDTRAQIEELLAIARQARDLRDHKGFAIARACIVDAARLKLQKPAEAPAPSMAQAAIIAELDRDMSDEEWTRRFGPEPPGGKMGDVGPW